MKMKKKLAALLAAAMIASVMPMTAFAATTNRVVAGVKVANGGSTQVDAPQLVIKNDNKDVDFVTERDFYLNLDGAEFLTDGAILYTLEQTVGGKFVPSVIGETGPKGAYTTKRTPDSRGYYKVMTGDYANMLFRLDYEQQNYKGEYVTGGRSMAINVPSIDSTRFDAIGGDFKLPILAKVTSESATIAIDGASTGISSSVSSVFATAGDSKSTVIIGDVPSIYYARNLDLAKITIQENYKGAFADAAVKGKLQIEVELDSNDYDFITHNGETLAESLKIVGTRGFSTEYATTKFKNKGRDNRTLVIEFDAPNMVLNQWGAIEFVLPVSANTKDPEVGPLKADIRSEFFTDQTVTLANVAAFGVEIVPKEDYKFITGQKEKVKFNFNELVADSLVDNRATEFTLSKGVTFTEGSIRINGEKPKVTVYGGDILTNDDPQTITVYLDSKRANLDKYTFEAEINITSAFEGDIELTATGRAVDEAVTAVLAETTPPVKVTIEPIQVKAGLKVQSGGKIVISETDKARLMSGNDIVISLDKESGMTLTGAKVALTGGDLKTGDVTVKAVDGELRVSVKRRSKVASTIELTEIELKIDRSVPIGEYKVSVGGPAISKLATDAYDVVKAEFDTYYELIVDAAGKAILDTNGDKQYVEKDIVRKVGTKVAAELDPIVSKEFVLLGDPILGLKSTVVFTIGSAEYTVDGKKETMDAEAYIKDGRTMVPVRYLANALGVAPESIKFNQDPNGGIVTIFVDNGNVVQLQLGSKNLVTNGMNIPMEAAAEIVDGRTYVPVREIGAVFGVNGVWDAATQTATFAK